MRRHVATFVAAALLLSLAGPAAAADPGDPLQSTPAPEVTPAPEPTPHPVGTPDATRSPEATPAPDETTVPAPVSVPEPAITPAPQPVPSSAAPDAADPAGRWIVVYRNGTDVAATSVRQAKRVGFKADRTFSHAIRGLTARLSPKQVKALRDDPTVLAVVPDEKIEISAQHVPNGINRIDGRLSAAAKVDGIDERVDADVAIVDTGIARVADLNVAGGYNCSTADRTLWRDVHGHGTHVAGTVGALDNATGVVGVAPGVRLWAVKILDDTGSGLLSWYVCGLDWIAAQRDPVDPSRPRFESVNMSVTKWGRDDGACGSKTADILHAAICRVVASGVTVVAAAANDSGSAAARVPAAYNEVITVSALADTDGKSGALGTSLCYSWGTYDDDDSFANFSNYGSDVDIIAPGKCIWSTVPGGYMYMSGTSMAAPHVAGAAALVKATRPQLTPGEVREALIYLGTRNWKLTSDPDSVHENLLNVSRLGSRGNFSLTAGPTLAVPEIGGTAVFPVTVTRSATHFERIFLSAASLPAGVTASFNTTSVYGFAGVSATLTVKVPPGTRTGTYQVKVIGSEHGTVREALATFAVKGDAPVASPPLTDAFPNAVIGATTFRSRLTWPAATDKTSPIAGYEVQGSVDGGAWSPTTSVGAATRLLTPVQAYGHTYKYRVRAKDAVGNWSAWAEGATTTPRLVENTSTSVAYRGSWVRYAYRYASGGSSHYAVAAGASAKVTFTGRAVGFIAAVGPTRGSARIYVDGVYRGIISLRATRGGSRLVKYSIATSTLGTHTLEVRLAGNGRVDVDGFITFR